MMRKKFISALFLFVLLLSLSRCKPKVAGSADDSNISYQYKGLRDIIGKFISTASQSKDSIISVDLKKRSDSTILLIANVFPDLSNTKFIGFDTIMSKRVYFIGDTSRYIYFTTFEQQTPTELTTLNKRLHDSTMPPLAVDPQLWAFYFKDSLLIGFTPKEEIGKYLH